MKPLENQTNVFGDPLQSCSMDPVTGFFRTGCCDADSEDIGKHFVCARVDDNFLQYRSVRAMTSSPVSYTHLTLPTSLAV